MGLAKEGVVVKFLGAEKDVDPVQGLAAVVELFAFGLGHEVGAHQARPKRPAKIKT